MKLTSILTGLMLTSTQLVASKRLLGVDQQPPQELCLSSTLSSSYANAIQQFPYLKQAIEQVGRQPIAKWYTDTLDDYKGSAQQMFAECATSARPVVVIYGLPNKDCKDHFSSNGKNTNTANYRDFVQQLVTVANNRPVVYIIEPDAIGLLANNGCGNTNGYADNLRMAIDMLGQNPNADMYLDIGYWTLADITQSKSVADLVKEVDPNKRCKGISLNTSNYRSISEMADACKRFSDSLGNKYHCIVDTSRNQQPGPSNNEWCNVKNAGIGALPTKSTGHDLIDYFVWIKPPGESDGECTGRTSESLPGGPPAGKFFAEHFTMLWNNGHFVQNQQMRPLDINKVKDPTAVGDVNADASATSPAVVPTVAVNTSFKTNDLPTMIPIPVTASAVPDKTSTVGKDVNKVLGVIIGDVNKPSATSLPPSSSPVKVEAATKPQVVQQVVQPPPPAANTAKPTTDHQKCE